MSRLLLLLLTLPGLCAAQPRMVVDDPALLAGMEQHGYGLAEAAMAAGSGNTDNQALYRQPRYRAMADALTADLGALRKADPQLGTGMRYGHRLFDSGWLRSPKARFELAGVVNRMDRAPFDPDSCGELRLIYRLAYTDGAVYSRLPMTVNAVFLQSRDADGGCLGAARSWQHGGSVILADTRLKSVEANLQSVRWPSTVRPDMGGYAEYLLRVFVPAGDKLRPATLENTPDVARIGKDPARKQRLLRWLRDPANFRSIDEGWALLPQEFLATQATSVALHGVHRLANMPYSQLFTEHDFRDMPYAQARYVRSPQGMLRRLDDLSCSGCHQGRTIAGFHFPGSDRSGTGAANSIAVGASPHFIADQPRRAKYYSAVLEGREPERARALSMHADEEPGASGAHCGLGDASFASWTCATGLHCERLIADNRLSRTGVCTTDAPRAGNACQAGRMLHDRNPWRDRLSLQPASSCGDGVCESSSVGFPGGMCSRGDCASAGAGETCGAIAVLQGFNDCLAQGRPFAQCLEQNVRPAVQQACDAQTACRDDYICSRTPSGKGACIPPYFLFQLRVDGHPAP